jgi:hypothetical protein
MITALFRDYPRFRTKPEATMGEFARQVKNGTIHGPHRPKFNREAWEALARREDTVSDSVKMLENRRVENAEGEG